MAAVSVGDALDAPSFTSKPRTARLVCTEIINPTVLGEAISHGEAAAILREWARGSGGPRIAGGAKLALVRLSLPTGERQEPIEAWVPVSAWSEG